MLVLVGIFLAGGITGAFAAREAREWFFKRPGPEQWAPTHLKRLTDQLKLPEDQAEKIRPIIRRHMTEMGKLRENWLTETKEIRDRMEREVGEQLTPDQRARYEQINRAQREKEKKLFLDRNTRAPGQGGTKSEKERPRSEQKSEAIPPARNE